MQVIASLLVLGLICLLWMIPILGTFITSFRSLDAVNNSGWWTVFRHPLTMDLTLHNYHEALFGNACSPRRACRTDASQRKYNPTRFQ